MLSGMCTCLFTTLSYSGFIPRRISNSQNLILQYKMESLRSVLVCCFGITYTAFVWPLVNLIALKNMDLLKGVCLGTTCCWWVVVCWKWFLPFAEIELLCSPFIYSTTRKTNVGMLSEVIWRYLHRQNTIIWKIFDSNIFLDRLDHRH